jgi:hypothetical protein
MRNSHGGYSRTAKARRRRAASLSQQMRRGDGKAAFSLWQRRRALAGIKKNGWSFKVNAMNCARYRKRQLRLHAAAVVAERQRQEAQSTVKLDAGARAALRARYGRGGFCVEYREGECRPVAPGVECPACGWKWGNREPHVVGVP